MYKIDTMIKHEPLTGFNMAAPTGNRFWELRATHGPKMLFSPDELWEACQEYFYNVEENPLIEEKAFSSKEGIQYAKLKKMRAMTIDGLCTFLDIDNTTWYDWRKDESKGLSHIVARAERIIRDQKFTGAAADLLNPN